jgi:2,3-dihydroxybenzoate-AMP ligase
LGALHNGGKVVLIPSTGTEDVLEAIQKEKVTIMPTPPALLIRWMESEELPKYDITSLEVVLAGGAKLNAEVAKKVKPVLGCYYHQNLGMAEGMLFWSRKGILTISFSTPRSPMFEDDESGL